MGMSLNSDTKVETRLMLDCTGFFDDPALVCKELVGYLKEVGKINALTYTEEVAHCASDASVGTDR